MKNPITIFEEIKSKFELYAKTRFKTHFPSIEKEREELLNKEGIFYQYPWIELIRRYKSSGKHINDLKKDDLYSFSGSEIEDFQSFILSGLFSKDNSLYEHQYKVLKKSLKGEKCSHNIRNRFR